jgi:hypothetical protein
VLVIYLAADFVDASAPGVFFFDSALFLGTVVQSKVRSAEAVDRSHDACAALDDGRPSLADEQRPIPGLYRTSVLVTTYAPLARNATSTLKSPAAAEDH